MTTLEYLRVSFPNWLAAASRHTSLPAAPSSSQSGAERLLSRAYSKAFAKPTACARDRFSHQSCLGEGCFSCGVCSVSRVSPCRSSLMCCDPSKQGDAARSCLASMSRAGFPPSLLTEMATLAGMRRKVSPIGISTETNNQINLNNIK